MSNENRQFFYTKEVGQRMAGGGTEVFRMQESFNLDYVIRTFWKDPQTFVVMMADGHEEARDIEKDIVKDGKLRGKETKRERDWYVSHVELRGDDVVRFRLASELIVPQLSLEAGIKMGIMKVERIVIPKEGKTPTNQEIVAETKELVKEMEEMVKEGTLIEGTEGLEEEKEATTGSPMAVVRD